MKRERGERGKKRAHTDSTKVKKQEGSRDREEVAAAKEVEAAACGGRGW